jgi:hypothetical protein
MLLDSELLGAAYLLLNLELVYDRCQLRQDLVCLLVKFELCSNELGEVAEGFRSIKDLLEIKSATASVPLLLRAWRHSHSS